MKQNGQIEVICGPMFAGKTEELIRRANRLDYAKKKYLVFKPTIDDRYSATEIVSHSNYRKNSICIKHSSEILDYITDDIKAVVVDEAQFFDEGLIKIIESLAGSGVRVIAAGLDQDFRGEPFGIMPILMSKAEYVTKLQGICMVCGAPATRTQRIINGRPADYDDPTILVSASEKYESRCRHCHQVPRKAYEN